MKTKIIQNIKSIILALILVVGVSYVSAATSTWSPAHQTPTNCDPALDSGCNPPINVSITPQIKAGSLTLGGLGIFGNFSFLPLSGTSPTAGQVLMADDSNIVVNVLL